MNDQRYTDPDFDPLACNDLDELTHQIRAVATDLGVHGFGMKSDALGLAREVYGALRIIQAREAQHRERVTAPLSVTDNGEQSPCEPPPGYDLGETVTFGLDSESTSGPTTISFDSDSLVLRVESSSSAPPPTLADWLAIGIDEAQPLIRRHAALDEARAVLARRLIDACYAAVPDFPRFDWGRDCFSYESKEYCYVRWPMHCRQAPTLTHEQDTVLRALGATHVDYGGGELRLGLCSAGEVEQ